MQLCLLLPTLMRNPSSAERARSQLPAADAAAAGVLVILVIAFFWRLVFTDQILPRGDVFTYFTPYWAYRDAALRAGRIPLWNPELFMGAPLLANSQAGVLYPPNWPAILFDAPTAIKVSIVAHAAWAALGMYVFSRSSLGTSQLGSLLAGATWALGGYFSAQVEHVNQVQGLAWLPWAFSLWDQARTRWRWIAGLGAVMAMQLLAGHSQTAFISGVGLGLWAVWHTVMAWRARPPGPARGIRSPRSLPMAPLATLAAAATLAVLLSAIQLLPTLELARLSNRGGGLSFLEAVSFSLRPQLIGRALLPAYVEPALFSEYIAYAGIVSLSLAAAAAWRGRRDPYPGGLLLLSAAGLFLALGAYNPFYWVLVRGVPGFALFRAPARWLALWAFGVSALAGQGLDQLSAPNYRERWLWALPGLLAGLLAGLAPLAALSAAEVAGASAPAPGELAAWALIMILTSLLIAWLAHSRQAATAYGGPLLASLACVELFIASRALPYNNLSTPAAWSSQRPAISTLLAEQAGRPAPPRFLSLSDIRFDPGDLREIEAVFGPHLSQQGLYDYVIATKQKEVLTPNLPMAWGIPAMDGFDGGILPTRDYTRFTGLFLDAAGAVSPDGRLRENLKGVPDLYWLEVANVGYLITDKVYDAWLDGVYYDLQFTRPLHASAGGPAPPPLTAVSPRPFSATAVGIVGHVEGAPGLPDGTQVGSVMVAYEGMGAPMNAVVLPLRLGYELAEGEPAAAQHRVPPPAGAFTPQRPGIVEYRALMQWGPPALPVEEVVISPHAGFPGTLVVRGITLIDERTGVFQPLSLWPSIRVIHSGDTKVYAFSHARPRAYVVCAPIVVAEIESAWELLPARDQTVIVDPEPPPASNCEPGAAGDALITTYEPERVAVEAEARVQGSYLVLSDAWYPGWQASIDGEPASVLHANGLFRAVRLPEGRHEVVFTYRSRPFEIGAAISGISLLGMAAALIRPPGRRAH